MYFGRWLNSPASYTTILQIFIFFSLFLKINDVLKWQVWPGKSVGAFTECSPHSYFKNTSHSCQLLLLTAGFGFPPGHRLASLHSYEVSARGWKEIHLEQNGDIWSSSQLFGVWVFFFPFSPGVHAFGWHQHASCMLSALHRKENNSAKVSSYKPSGTQENSDSTGVSWLSPENTQIHQNP